MTVGYFETQHVLISVFVVTIIAAVLLLLLKVRWLCNVMFSLLVHDVCLQNLSSRESGTYDIF